MGSPAAGLPYGSAKEGEVSIPTLSASRTFPGGNCRSASWMKLSCLPPPAQKPCQGRITKLGPSRLQSCHVQFTTRLQWHLGAGWMEAHPHPQTVGAANDWVLMMPAISAHDKMVGGPLTRGMWEGTEQTFGAADRWVACTVQRTWEELLSLRFVQRNWARGKEWLLWPRGPSCHTLLASKIGVNHRVLRGLVSRCC